MYQHQNPNIDWPEILYLCSTKTATAQYYQFNTLGQAREGYISPGQKIGIEEIKEFLDINKSKVFLV